MAAPSRRRGKSPDTQLFVLGERKDHWPPQARRGRTRCPKPRPIVTDNP